MSLTNDVAITPGAGANILTHDAGDASHSQVQVVKPGNSDQELLSSASVNVSASGDNTLIAAVASKVVRVYRALLFFAGAVNIKFTDGAAGTNLVGNTIPVQAGGSLILDFDGEAWFKTTAGNAFVLNLSTGVQVSGRVWYTQV